MFTHQLSNSDGLYAVEFSDYAKRYYLKVFEKKYRGMIWKVTETSIIYDLAYIHNKMQFTQQVDELKQVGDRLYFKYDFAIAKSSKSPKASGNRCICLLEDDKKKITILAICHKSDLPKNINESAWGERVIGNFSKSNN